MTVTDPVKQEKNSPSVPAPPHPVERREPLPAQRPKSSHDDAGAPDAVQKILACPSYRLAEEDIDFLRGPQNRGTRLQLEYFKAESLLQKHGVAHTIVVFGGTRILE